MDQAMSDEQAAAKAVQGVIDRVLTHGATPEQAEAVQDAVRLALLGKTDKAFARLLDVGFDEEFAQWLLNDVRAAMDEAAKKAA